MRDYPLSTIYILYEIYLLEWHMEMTIDFPGGTQVDAHFGPYTVQTDQPAPAGKASAPSPFEVFLASLGTCAGIYVLGFCRKRGLPTDGLRLIQRSHTNPA